MLLHDDVIYDILLRLPVISLLRFKSICKSWRALIGSSDFIKQHLHHHHYSCPNLKDKNHNLISCPRLDSSPINFLLTSAHNFEAPAVNLQLEPLDLFEHLLVYIHDIASFNGIVCLSIYQPNVRKYFICLWNPATKQSRLLPEPPSPFKPELISVGFGFDVKANDYKVVKLIRDDVPAEKRVDVYNLSTHSWRSIDPVFPGDLGQFLWHPRMPFHNGTCFCWMGLMGEVIFCFDFGSEMFRSISLPGTDEHNYRALCIVSDKIACLLTVELQSMHTDIWVLDEYGSANESWAKLYKIDLYSVKDIKQFTWLLMCGNYLFFGTWDQVCRHSVLTKEVKDYSLFEFQENLRDSSLGRHFGREVALYKESLVSVGGQNNAPGC